jgi:hypothetical protein
MYTCLLTTEEQENYKQRHSNDGVRNTANKQPKWYSYTFYAYTSSYSNKLKCSLMDHLIYCMYHSLTDAECYLL